MNTSAIAFCACLLLAAQTFASGEQNGMAHTEAIQKLKQGNARYTSGESLRPRQGQARRAETTRDGQRPFATVVACSDSRVPPEILFDQGVGDLFVIRTAGNVIFEAHAGSIDFGVDYLETPILVVLGHTHCNAVCAATTEGEKHGDNIEKLVDHIRPAVQRAVAAGADSSREKLIAASTRENIWQSIENILKHSPACVKRASRGELKAYGAVYDIETGRVDWMGEHPLMAQIVESANSAHVHGIPAQTRKASKDAPQATMPEQGKEWENESFWKD